MAATGAGGPAPATPPLLATAFRTVFRDVLPVTPFGVHRFPGGLEPGVGCAIDAAGAVVPWTDAQASATADGFVGTSAFAPMASPHGVPHSKYWADSCARLLRMPPAFHGVYDIDTELRARRGRATGTMNAAHISLFVIAGGLSPRASDAALNGCCVPCDIRAAADAPPGGCASGGGDGGDGIGVGDGDFLPALDGDLDGVEDGLVRALYSTSARMYPRVSAAVQVALNSVMTAIALHKPTVSQLCGSTAFPPPLLLWWHAALVACDTVAVGGEFVQLGFVQSLLEGAADKSTVAVTARDRLVDDALEVDDTYPFVSGAHVSALDEGVESDSAVPEVAKCGAASSMGGIASVAAAAWLWRTYEALLKAQSPQAQAARHADLLLVKVAFLADVHALVTTGGRLFDEPPEAWRNGPCYPRAYAFLKARASGLPCQCSIEETAADGLPDAARGLLGHYLHRYMHVRAVDLVRALHATAFWKSLPAPLPLAVPVLGSPRHVISAAELMELVDSESPGSPALVALLDLPSHPR